MGWVMLSGSLERIDRKSAAVHPAGLHRARFLDCGAN
jgi:hypothetical protein